MLPRATPLALALCCLKKSFSPVFFSYLSQPFSVISCSTRCRPAHHLKISLPLTLFPQHTVSSKQKLKEMYNLQVETLVLFLSTCIILQERRVDFIYTPDLIQPSVTGAAASFFTYFVFHQFVPSDARHTSSWLSRSNTLSGSQVA